ncbi:MAG: hypothetical protein WDA19_12035 [Mariniphaga sp.]
MFLFRQCQKAGLHPAGKAFTFYFAFLFPGFHLTAPAVLPAVSAKQPDAGLFHPGQSASFQR